MCSPFADPGISSLRLPGSVSVVTGASSGIGRAIALALASQGARLYLIGRNPAGLADTAASAREFSEVTECQIDLTADESIRHLVSRIEAEAGRVDILVHSAGIISLSNLAKADIADLDSQFATNVRAPYLLTQRLLPLLTVAAGQIVFINSSSGLAAKRPDVGQYAATKHALKAIADSVREEVNPLGIRVLSMYLGRTATPMQDRLYQRDNQPYDSAVLLQPEDVASVVLHALLLPATAEVTDISMRPARKSY